MGNLSNCMSLDDNDNLQAVQEAHGRSQQITPQVETFTPIGHFDFAVSRKTAHSLQAPAIKRVAHRNQPLELGAAKFGQSSSSLRNLRDDPWSSEGAAGPGVEVGGGWHTTSQKESTGAWDANTTGSPGTAPTGSQMSPNDALVVVIDEVEYYQDPGNRRLDADGFENTRNSENNHASVEQAGATATLPGLSRSEDVKGFTSNPEGQHGLLSSFPQGHQKQEGGFITTLQLPNSAASQIGNTPHAGKTGRTGSPELKSVPLKRDLIKNCFRNLQLIEANRRSEPASH